MNGDAPAMAHRHLLVLVADARDDGLDVAELSLEVLAQELALPGRRPGASHTPEESALLLCVWCSSAAVPAGKNNNSQPRAHYNSARQIIHRQQTHDL